MKLPPFTPLRTFEAAALHLSVSRAAAELHVTQGAVSQQIKQLEKHFGFTLFRHLPRTLEPTDEGRAFHEVVGSVLKQISVRWQGMGELRYFGHGYVPARQRDRLDCDYVALIEGHAFLVLGVAMPALAEVHPTSGRACTVDKTPL